MQDSLQNRAHQVVRFVARLSDASEAIWLDDLGSYRIRVGEGILGSELAQLSNARIVVSDFVRGYLPAIECGGQERPNPDSVVSIGASETHGAAKRLCQRLGCALVTVPIPLANDAFCTNRCDSAPAGPSYACVYPAQTIVDVGHLLALPLEANVAGLGEFVGLYCSAIDYCASREAPIPESLLGFVAESFRDLCEALRLDSRVFLRKLACCLVAKCLLMRANRDHQIGCGIDHLFAHHLGKVLEVPHGKAVYWGAILSLALFPEWEAFGLDLATLMSHGIDTSMISPKEACLIAGLDFPGAVQSSVKTRPGRPTQVSLSKELDRRTELAADRLRRSFAMCSWQSEATQA